MSNPERGGFNPEHEQPERKTLIKGTMGNKELEASFNAFAEQAGQAGVDIGSPEGQPIRREWLLQQAEMSPELNNETMYVAKDVQKELERALREGNKEGALSAIEQLKGLINKLEQGVAAIE